MTAPDALQTVAEIGIAFAGFSGLIMSLRRHQGPLNEVEKFRLLVLLALSLGAMFLSFLPGWLELLGLEPARAWAFSSAVMALYSLLFIALWVARSIPLVRVVPEIFDWFAFARMATGHVVVVAAQLAVILSLAGDRVAAICLAGLLWYLLHAAQQFARMLFVQPRGAQGPQS